MIAGALFREHRGVVARRHVGVACHGLTHGLMNAEWLAVKLVAGAQLSVHFFGKMVEAGVIIVFAADDHDVIGCAMRNHVRGLCGVCHRVEEN